MNTRTSITILVLLLRCIPSKEVSTSPSLGYIEATVLTRAQRVRRAEGSTSFHRRLLGFRVQGLGFRVQGLGFRLLGLGFGGLGLWAFGA